MSTINDLSSNKVYHISNEFAFFLNNKSGFDINDLFVQKQKGLREIIEFFVNNNLITTLDLINFIKVVPDYIGFNNINNCIVDYSSNSNYKLSDYIINISKLGVKHVQIRFYGDNYFDELLATLEISKSENLSIVSFEVLINLHDIPKLEEELTVLSNYNRLLTLIIFYKKNKSTFKPKVTKFKIHYVKRYLINKKCCGYITPEYFMLNRNCFAESKSFNNCLNGKLSIDENGYIKNCPSMPESYGNIKDTTLEEAIKKPDFKKYWNITKDDIEICKDCEFRYICTDCRAYTERTKFGEKDLDLSKPLKCGYNPYTNEWAEWSTNPLKQKAIDYYGMQEIIDNAKN